MPLKGVELEEVLQITHFGFFSGLLEERKLDHY